MKIFRHYQVWIGIFFFFFIIALRYTGFLKYLTFENFQLYKAQVIDLIEHYYALSVILYISAYIGIVFFALPLAAFFTIAGGFLFGVIPTVIYTNIGATIGATLFFLLVRFSLGTAIQKQYEHKLRFFNAHMHKYGAMSLLAWHCIAVIPFSVLNTIIGISNVSLWTFIWTTSLGIIPGSAIYAFAGKQLGTIVRFQDIFSWRILIALILLAAIGIISILWQYVVSKNKQV